ncbi:unnamed protein product, partial [Amoebophrya sp. A120]
EVTFACKASEALLRMRLQVPEDSDGAAVLEQVVSAFVTCKERLFDGTLSLKTLKFLEDNKDRFTTFYQICTEQPSEEWAGRSSAGARKSAERKENEGDDPMEVDDDVAKEKDDVDMSQELVLANAGETTTAARGRSATADSLGSSAASPRKQKEKEIASKLEHWREVVTKFESDLELLRAASALPQ